jgi:hypothetical protein
MRHRIDLLRLKLAIQLRHLWEHARNKLLLPLYWTCFVGGLPVSLYWMFHLPPAGVAIGALGAVGVLVALKEGISPNHRFLWAVTTLFLLVVEVRAINNDREEQFESHIHELSWQRAAQAQTLLQIVEANRAEMSQNDAQFKGTISEMKDLGGLSRRAITLSGSALEHITGGDAYCYFAPQPPLNGVGNFWQLSIGNTGDLDLPTCDYQIFEVPAPNDTPQEIAKKLNLNTFQVHNFGRVQKGLMTTAILIEVGQNKRYQFTFRTPTREVLESIDFIPEPKSPSGYKAVCEIRIPGGKVLSNSCYPKKSGTR